MIINKEEVIIKTQCRICNTSEFDKILKLRDTPLEDQYLKTNIEQKTYPLTLLKCQNCEYIFLKEVVSPQISYSEYLYESKVTNGLDIHYDQYISNIIKKYKIPKKSLAVDLGSNDGLMLSLFKKNKLIPLGVEPAKEIASRANSIGLTTINSFFGNATSNFIIKNYSRSMLITANYMFANIDNLDEFLHNVVKILHKKGVFIIQTGYHPDQFKKNMFDYIYHEHFSYFCLNTLDKILKKYDLKVVDAERISPKGGSLRVVCVHKHNSKRISNSYFNLLEYEKKGNFNAKSYFEKLRDNIDKEKLALTKILSLAKKQEKTIVGFGASHSTTTLMYEFELHKFIDYVVDDNESKQNTFTPGINIPVFNTKKIHKEKPDLVIILAWQHRSVILDKHKNYLDKGGVFLLPLPSLKVKKT